MSLFGNCSNTINLAWHRIYMNFTTTCKTKQEKLLCLSDTKKLLEEAMQLLEELTDNTLFDKEEEEDFDDNDKDYD